MLVSPGPILSYPFHKLLLSRPQSSHSVTVRGNKTTTSKECLDAFLLSLTVQHCWNLLAILEWVGTCQRMALSRCYCQRCTFWTKSILSVLVSRFSFWPCIYVFSSFICWNISSICAGLCTPLITWNSFASSHPSSVKNAVGQTQVGTLLRHSQFLRSNKCANHQTQTLASWGKIQHWISFSLLTKPLLCRPRLLIQTFSMLKTFWYELIFFCFWDLASNSLLSSLFLELWETFSHLSYLFLSVFFEVEENSPRFCFEVADV